MTYLSLDLSKRSTGWALWRAGWDRPRFGHWQLGSEYTSNGRVFAKLHHCLSDLRQIEKFENIFYEQKVNPANLNGQTNRQAVTLAGGLEAHVESFAYAMGCRASDIHIATWRGEFIGKDLVGQARSDARARSKATAKKHSARDALKQLTIERCRTFGWSPQNDDEADALGILDYCLAQRDVQTPWRAEEVLRPMMGVR